jgi:hypothetical protein
MVSLGIGWQVSIMKKKRKLGESQFLGLNCGNNVWYW